MKFKVKESMDKFKKVRVFFFSLLVLSALADVVSFMWDSKLHMFEINPVFLIFKSVWILSIFKMVVIFLMGLAYYKMQNRTQFGQFFWCFIVFSVTILLFHGTYSNIQTILKMQDIPKENYEKYVIPKEQAVQKNAEHVTLVVYLPLILGLITFKIWQWSFRQEDNIEWREKDGKRRVF